MGLKDEDMAGLSAEEREALAEGEAAELDALKKIAGDSGDEDDAADGGGVPGDEDAEVDAAGAAAETEADGAQTAGATEDDGPEPFVPVYQAQLPENFETSLGEISIEREALAEKFKAGDMQFEEFRVADKALQAKETALLALRTKSEIAAEMAQQSAAQRWSWEVTRFMRDTLKGEGIDYKNNRLLNAAFDIAVKDLAGAAENADKTGEWFLEEAHKLVKAQLGVGKVPKKDDPLPADPVKAAVNARKNAVPSAPKTLGSVPAAAESDVGQDEFAQLEQLAGTDVMAYERALAKLTPEQERRYLRVAA